MAAPSSQDPAHIQKLPVSAAHTLSVAHRCTYGYSDSNQVRTSTVDSFAILRSCLAVPQLIAINGTID